LGFFKYRLEKLLPNGIRGKASINILRFFATYQQPGAKVQEIQRAPFTKAIIEWHYE
jgi:hypothetical protein